MKIVESEGQQLFGRVRKQDVLTSRGKYGGKDSVKKWRKRIETSGVNLQVKIDPSLGPDNIHVTDDTLQKKRRVFPLKDEYYRLVTRLKVILEVWPVREEWIGDR